MPTLRFLVWNMEWMNDLFGPNDQPVAFRADGDHPAHHAGATVRQRRDHLAGVLNELAPDVVIVVEGPNQTDELQLFFDSDVQGTWKTQVQPSKGMSQCLGLAVRTDTGHFDDPPFRYHDTANLPVFDEFRMDTDDDEVDEVYKFERRPLYAELRPAGGQNFRVLGLHLKSKGIFGAYEWSKWWQLADGNRRKLLAQAGWLRLQFLDPYLSDPETKNVPLVVCGDINDGPGLDASEKRLLGSAVERLMGTLWRPELCLGNALFDTLNPKQRAALRFEDLATTRFKDPIFENTWHNEWIDHILYTRCDAPYVGEAQIHKLMPDGQPIWKKYKHASDHYPVSAVLNV